MISLVQQTQNHATTGATNITLTWPQAPTAGNIIIVAFGYNNNITSVVDTNVVFTQQENYVGDINHDNSALYTGIVGGSASTSLVITASANTEFAAIAVEFSGLSTAALVASDHANAGDLSTTTPNSGSVSPKGDGILVAFSEQVSGATPTGRPGGRWIDLSDSFQTTGNTIGLTGVYQLVGAQVTGLTTPTWTYSGSQFALGTIASINKAPLLHNMKSLGNNLRPAPFKPGIAR